MIPGFGRDQIYPGHPYCRDVIRSFLPFKYPLPGALQPTKKKVLFLDTLFQLDMIWISLLYSFLDKYLTKTLKLNVSWCWFMRNLSLDTILGPSCWWLGDGLCLSPAIIQLHTTSTPLQSLKVEHVRIWSLPSPRQSGATVFNKPSSRPISPSLHQSMFIRFLWFRLVMSTPWNESHWGSLSHLYWK